MATNNWKLHAVKNKAESLGLRVGFAPKLFGPKHVQNRLYINGHRCQLAARLDQPGNAAQNTSLPVPQSTWASFVIFVPPPGQDAPFLIVPRDALNTFSQQNDCRVENYAEGWFLLKAQAARTHLSAP